MQAATRDYTLNMHKRLQGVSFKARATRAVREIARFAAKEMHTKVSKVIVAFVFIWLVLANSVIGCESGYPVEQVHVVSGY